MMDEINVVVFSGLLAGLIAVAAFNISEKGTPRELRWSFAGSWVTTSAVIVAWALVTFVQPSNFLDSILDASLFEGPPLLRSQDLESIPVVFGLLLVLTPLIYRTLAAEGKNPRLAFTVTAGVSAWASLTIFIVGAFRIFGLVDTYPIIPRLVILAIMVLVVFGVFVQTSKSLQTSAKTWTLP